MTSGALWSRKMEHQARGCSVTPGTGLLQEPTDFLFLEVNTAMNVLSVETGIPE